MILALQSAAVSPFWGIGVPAFIFIVAFVVTWLLYRHFSKSS